MSGQAKVITGSACAAVRLNVVTCHIDNTEGIMAIKELKVWDGTGLPPVGCECEYLTNLNGPMRIKIECVTKDGVAFTWIDNADPFRGLDCVCIGAALEHIRPIRSEADKKRDAAIAKITDAICGEIPDTGMATAAKYAARAYDAVAAGKVPGVRCE